VKLLFCPPAFSVRRNLEVGRRGVIWGVSEWVAIGPRRKEGQRGTGPTSRLIRSVSMGFRHVAGRAPGPLVPLREFPSVGCFVF
jgi:hypothetical protein